MNSATNQNNSELLLQLQESERRLRAMMLQVPASVAILKGPNHVVEMVNQRSLEIWGRTEEEVLNKPIFDAMPELKTQGIKETLDEVYQTGNVFSVSELEVMIMRGGKKETIFVNASWEPIFSLAGEIDGLMVAGIEVTEQVAARKKIKESEERIRAMADNIPNLAWMAHADGWIYWYNKQWYEYTGTTPEQMEGWGWQSVHDARVLPDVLVRWRNCIELGKKFEMVFPILGSDGQFREFLTRVLPFHDDNGKIIQWFGSNTDITEQEVTRKKIEASEKQFRLLADSMPQHIWTADPQGNLNYYNQSIFDYTGLTLEEINTEGWIQIVHPDDREKNIKQWIESVTTGKDFLFEHRFRKHDGIYRWQLSRAKPQRDESGAIRMWVGTSTDIEEQKTFAEALETEVRDRTKELAENNIELAKMNKELQSFAYISSHDLQEPLRKIQTFASRIEEKEKDNLSETGKDLFMRMQKSAERMQLLIDDLLTYSRTHTLERDFVNVNLRKVIEKVMDDLHEEIQQKHAKIDIGEMCDVTVITFQFQQLFYNLISNSLKFANPQDPLHITIKSKQAKAESFKNKNLESNLNYCQITVADNGIGFESQYNEKIFELFQRLHGKDEYRGTGVGLAIVKRIVENHEGIITSEGEAGKGATFIIYIPVKN